MKRLVLKAACQQDVDEVVAKYDNVVGWDAKKWAVKLIKEHNIVISDDTPQNYESVIEADAKKKRYGTAAARDKEKEPA